MLPPTAQARTEAAVITAAPLANRLAALTEAAGSEARTFRRSSIKAHKDYGEQSLTVMLFARRFQHKHRSRT